MNLTLFYSNDRRRRHRVVCLNRFATRRGAEVNLTPFSVMVAGQQHRTMDMIDRVCVRLNRSAIRSQSS